MHKTSLLYCYPLYHETEHLRQLQCRCLRYERYFDVVCADENKVRSDLQVLTISTASTVMIH